jgi:hypothetical protein
MDKLQQERILNLTNRIIESTLKYINQNGTFTDVEDMDGKGGTKTQRLSNVTGLGEIRQLRTTIRRELGLDLVPSTDPVPGNKMGAVSLLTLIQDKQINLDQLQTLGGADNE